MDNYQRALEAALARHATVQIAIAVACSLKLKAKGTKLTFVAIEALADCIKLTGGDAFEFEATKQFLSATTVTALAITESMAELTIADIVRASKIIKKAATNTAERMFAKAIAEQRDGLRINRVKILRQLKREQRGFTQRLGRDWQQPLDSLLLLIWICRECGSSVNVAARSRATRAPSKKVEVLTRLHARACQTALEVHVLLSNGFADGALARWRTLYELDVVAAFVNRYGSSAAYLFTEHHVVCAKKHADAYNESAITLGLPKIPLPEYNRLVRKCRTLEKRYGKHFLGDYGWANIALKRPGRMTFRDIVNIVGYDHLRSDYATANSSIHATATSLYFRVGLHETHDEVLLAGPSNLGLVDVVSLTAQALLGLTGTTTNLKGNIDRLALLDVAQSMYSDLLQEAETADAAILDRGTAMAYALREPQPMS